MKKCPYCGAPEISILRFLQESITGVRGVVSSIRKARILMIKSWLIIVMITLIGILLIRWAGKETGCLAGF